MIEPVVIEAQTDLAQRPPGMTWSRQPPRIEDICLLASTDDWLHSLPKGVRPIMLPERFARITNNICRLWNNRVELDAYLFEKEVDKRGNRRGFPPLIREELLALRAYAAIGNRSHAH